MRLIDADELMEAINTWPKFGVDGRGRIVLWNEGYEPYIHLMDVVIAITGMPTIEERKTGKWVRYDGDWFKTMCKCSECGAMIDINEKYRNLFCYHCGLRMDGGQE